MFRGLSRITGTVFLEKGVVGEFFRCHFQMSFYNSLLQESPPDCSGLQCNVIRYGLPWQVDRLRVSHRPYELGKGSCSKLVRMGKLGLLHGARIGREACRQVSAGRALTHRAQSGTAQKNYMELAPCGLTTRRNRH